MPSFMQQPPATQLYQVTDSPDNDILVLGNDVKGTIVVHPKINQGNPNNIKIAYKGTIDFGCHQTRQIASIDFNTFKLVESDRLVSLNDDDEKDIKELITIAVNDVADCAYPAYILTANGNVNEMALLGLIQFKAQQQCDMDFEHCSQTGNTTINVALNEMQLSLLVFNVDGNYFTSSLSIKNLYTNKDGKTICFDKDELADLDWYLNENMAKLLPSTETA